MNTFTKKLLITTGLLMGLATGANALDVKVGIYGTPLTGFDKKRSYFPGLRGTNSLLGMQDYLRVLPIPDKCDWENFKGQRQMVEQQQCIVDSVFWRKFIVQESKLGQHAPVMKMKFGLDFDQLDKVKKLVGKMDEAERGLLMKFKAEYSGFIFWGMMDWGVGAERWLSSIEKGIVTGNEWVVVKVPLKTTILNRDKHITLIYWRDEAGKLKVGPITNPDLYMDGRFINQADLPYEYLTFSKGTKPGGGAGELLFNIGGKCEGC